MTTVLVLLVFIFAIRVVFIIFFHPAVVGDRKTIRASVKNLWASVRICQTAGFGKPSLKLKPAKRSVYLNLEFDTPDTVYVTMPLKLAKQQKAKEDYLKLFESHGLEVSEFTNGDNIDFLSFNADRTDWDLGRLIQTLYMAVFNAREDDIVNFTVETLRVDMPHLYALELKSRSHKVSKTSEAKRASYSGKSVTLYADTADQKTVEKETTLYKPNDTLKASSAKYNGRSIRQVQLSKTLDAAYYLLYPLIVILSYKWSGIFGMCWAALVFFSVYAVRNLINSKMSIWSKLFSWSWIYCILLAATLSTKDVDFLKLIPIVLGVVTLIGHLGMMLNIFPPFSKANKMQKQEDPKQFLFMSFFWVIGSIALAFAGQWARLNLSLDAWVTFFAFIRIEFMLGLVVIFTPAYMLYLTKFQNTASKTSGTS